MRKIEKKQHCKHDEIEKIFSTPLLNDQINDVQSGMAKWIAWIN